MFNINNLFIDNNNSNTQQLYYVCHFSITQMTKNKYSIGFSTFNKNWTDEQIIDYSEKNMHHKGCHSNEDFCVKIKTTYDDQKFNKQLFEYVNIIEILCENNNYENLEQNLLMIGEIIYHKKHINPNAVNVIFNFN